MKRQDLLPLRIGMTMLSVVAAAVIFRNSMQNADLSSVESGAVLQFINTLLGKLKIDLVLDDHIVRKTAHFVEYFILGGLLSGTAYAYALKLKGMFFAALPIGLIVAVCDELIQVSSPGRSCQISDIALDFSAVVTAAVILSLILMIHNRRRAKKEGLKT